jgi:hypothetical protein
VVVQPPAMQAANSKALMSFIVDPSRSPSMANA